MLKDKSYLKGMIILNKNPRCLYENSFAAFVSDTDLVVLGALCDTYHGVARTTTIDAWKGEISIMKDTLSRCGDKDGRIIFEYDIPRLGKRIDVVLLWKGINYLKFDENGRRVRNYELLRKGNTVFHCHRAADLQTVLEKEYNNWQRVIFDLNVLF